MRPLALALALSVGSAGCLYYDTDQEVCVDLTASYAGSTQGPVIATVHSKEGTLSFGVMRYGEEVQQLFAGKQNISGCAPRLEHREEVAMVHVWIDVDGSGRECLQGGTKPPDCPPPPNAPQASRELILPAYGRVAAPLHLELRDP